MNAPARSSDRVRELERQLHWAHLKIQSLEEQLRQDRIQQLGPKSETLSNLQLALLTEEEPSATSDEVEGSATSAVDTHAAARGQVTSGPKTAAACHQDHSLPGAHVQVLR